MHDDSGMLVLIPAWNEATRVGAVVEAFRGGLPVLVVDDGSVDGTGEVARKVGAEVIQHETNQGKGVALATGFRYALATGYRAVITLDADGQHDPAEAGKFIEAFERGEGDLIIGRRDFRQMPFPRAQANAIGSWMLSRVLHAPIYDNQSGYRLHSRRLLESLDLRMSGFEFEVDVIVQAVVLGLPIGWVEIRTIYGINKTSYFHPISDSLKFLGMVWHAYRSYRTLRRQMAG